MDDQLKHMIDIGSLGIMVTALVDLIPHLTALASLIWVVLRIYESDTVQKWKRRKQPERRGCYGRK